MPFTTSVLSMPTSFYESTFAGRSASPKARSSGEPGTVARSLKPLWSRVPTALQLPQVYRAAIGRQLRRSCIGGIAIKSTIAAFS